MPRVNSDKAPMATHDLIGQPAARSIGTAACPPVPGQLIQVIGAQGNAGPGRHHAARRRGRGIGCHPRCRPDAVLRHLAAHICWRGLGTLLLGIRDVTERLRLARALEAARIAHELALAVLRSEPAGLNVFLQDASTSVSLINSMMRLPARTREAFKEKLGRILEEVRSLRTRAEKFDLGPIAAQALAFEAALQALRSSRELSGDDFLPMSIQLDDLFALITTAGRLAEQRAASPPVQRRRSSSAMRKIEGPADWATDCSKRLKAMVARVGKETGHSAQLSIRGLEAVPECYRRNVDHMLLQLVRNAVEHGIEPQSDRQAARKPAEGSVTVECVDRGAAGVEITVRDDGRGFDVSLIGRVAVAKGLISPDALPTTDARTLFGLIFRPGFSTEGVEGCSGRGLGMVFLRELVTRMNGKVSVATKPNRYTRFTIVLPEAKSGQLHESPQRVA